MLLRLRVMKSVVLIEEDTSMKYVNKQTGETKKISFPWYWIISPICMIDLMTKGKIVHGLLGIIPLFALIWMFKYKTILDSALQKKGFVQAE